jgi:hypothetical protein
MILPRRPLIRRAVRRGVRRQTRRVIRRRLRRIRRGAATLLLLGSAAVKLRQDDVARIEAATGRPVEDLSEEDLSAAMKNQGIQKLELDDADRDAIAAADTDE